MTHGPPDATAACSPTCVPGTSDGIRCDEHGNVWAAAGGGGDGYDGVHVSRPTAP